MSEFAPWTSAKTSRPGSSTADVRAAAVRSLTQHVAHTATTNSAATEVTPHRPLDRTGGLLGNSGPRSGRRGSTATALVTGTVDTAEGWTLGTVPSHVELILLSEEELTSSPQQAVRGGTATAEHTPGRPAGAGADGLPVLSPQGSSGPLLSRQSARSGATVQTTRNALPSLNGTQTSTMGTTSRMGTTSPRRPADAELFGGPAKRAAASTARRTDGSKGKPRRQRGPAAPPEPESERFVVPRAIAHQIEQLRQLAWGGPAVPPPGPSTAHRGRPGDARAARAAPTAAEEVSPPTATAAGVPVGPPRVLPTVRLSPPRRDRSPPQHAHAVSPPDAVARVGLAAGGSPPYRASQQLDAMGWYRTEVAMLREQE